MAKKLIREYVFTPGVAGSATIKIPGRYTLDKVLLITNVTDNIILYNFADASFAGTTAVFTTGNDAVNFPAVAQAYDGYTTLTLQYNASGMSAGDLLQIYCEDTQDYGQKIRPWDFGTDAIERMRVSNPQSMIDADFEYGLQPTKWVGYGTVKGYPSTYDLPGVDLTVSTITTDYQTTSTTNSLISVAFTTTHGVSVGEVVNVSGLDAGIAGFSRADGSFIIASVPTTTTLKYFARGTVGTTGGQSLFTEEALVKLGKLFSGASIPVASASSNGADPSIITLNFASPHGLIAGTNIHTAIAVGVNNALASGPFFISTTPTATSLTYTARPGAAVTVTSGYTLYALNNATILHHPSDGGVILSTKTPSYAASVVRQTKRWFRYQSGKGFLWSSGTLFAPNYDVQSITASGTTVGSSITIRTDDIDHGLQPGAVITLSGALTSGYNNQYVVATIVDDYTFTVLALGTLGDTTAVLDMYCSIYVNSWTGAAVRAGMFDDQNGIFWEFDGNQMFCVVRTSTNNISGTMSVTNNSQAVTGTNTRFSEQVKAGTKIVIRGMTHFVTQVVSNTSMFVTPDYRGITASGVRGNTISERRIPQSDWNLDRCNGTGPSGYDWDFNKMQMIGIEYSWYGAGFIHFMVRGSDGKWVYTHRVKNNNLNNEAYMRSGNLPVRYSIENDAPLTYLTDTIDSADSVIAVAELGEFTDTGTLYIDNEMISYTGRSVTKGAGNFTGCTRAATLSQYQQGSTNNLTAGGAVPHSSNTGIIEISNTCSPTLTHWGSALMIDGGFTTDRGYLFNYQRVHLTTSTTKQTVFLIRLAPSVDNGLVGPLGSKLLLNRSQLLLQGITIAGANGTSSGAIVVEGILNPKNFTDATWTSLTASAAGGQPSFAQIATSVTWSTGTSAIAGEQIFGAVFPCADTGSISESLDLTLLKELTGAPLGGDYKFPDGSDILAINVRTTTGTARVSTMLRWSEAQA
jgi:hypothetical protein